MGPSPPIHRAASLPPRSATRAHGTTAPGRGWHTATPATIAVRPARRRQSKGTAGVSLLASAAPTLACGRRSAAPNCELAAEAVSREDGPIQRRWGAELVTAEPPRGSKETVHFCRVEDGREH